jgi:hypothetical protein
VTSSNLKRLHKALGLGIVVGIAAPAHGADETMFGEYLGALIKVTKKHEHITLGEPSLGIWTSLGLRGVAPQMRDQAAYLTLGGGAGGRSLGSI